MEALDPNESNPLVLWAEIARLQAATKGPEGHASWQDAATTERLRRVEVQRQADALLHELRALNVDQYGEQKRNTPAGRLIERIAAVNSAEAA